MADLTKSLWIDLDNSPHVPLFAPIIRDYRKQGIDVIVTARDHAQTIELLELHALTGTYKAIGKHYGGNKLAKTWGVMVRASKLVSYITSLSERPSIAVSHGSRSMVVAAKWLRIPVLTMYDYEFTETSIFNRFSHKVLVPELVPDDVLPGLPARKLAKYPGMKEELYVRGFVPDEKFRQSLGSANDRILAILRPPATTANYHDEKSSVLLDDVLHFLLNAAHIFTIIVPRTPDQAAELTERIKYVADAEGKCLILKTAVDGLQLAYASDLLISGGGTMNREAALLGVPVYSIFAGRQGALDRAMEAEGLITFIRDARDLSKIRLEHRDRSAGVSALTDRVEKSVIEQIDLMLADKS